MPFWLAVAQLSVHKVIDTLCGWGRGVGKYRIAGGVLRREGVFQKFACFMSIWFSTGEWKVQSTVRPC